MSSNLIDYRYFVDSSIPKDFRFGITTLEKPLKKDIYITLEQDIIFAIQCHAEYVADLLYQGWCPHYVDGKLKFHLKNNTFEDLDSSCKIGIHDNKYYIIYYDQRLGCVAFGYCPFTLKKIDFEDLDKENEDFDSEIIDLVYNIDHNLSKIQKLNNKDCKNEHTPNFVSVILWDKIYGETYETDEGIHFTSGNSFISGIYDSNLFITEKNKLVLAQTLELCISHFIDILEIVTGVKTTIYDEKNISNMIGEKRMYILKTENLISDEISGDNMIITAFRSGYVTFKGKDDKIRNVHISIKGYTKEIYPRNRHRNYKH